VPSLSELLERDPAESTLEIWGRSRELAREAKLLSNRLKDELVRRLDNAWPDEGFQSAIQLDAGRGYTISWSALAWLNYGPALSLALTPERWAQIVCSGAAFALDDWLRETWTPEATDQTVALCTSDDARVWDQVLSATPEPVPEILVTAITERLRTFDEPHRFEFDRIIERLANEGRIDALRSLAAVDDRFHEASRQYLALFGDRDELQHLIAELKEELAHGRRPQRENLRWLAGAASEDYIDELFACLILARSVDFDPFGPQAVVENVLAAIGGEAVIAGYDTVISERPFDGAQFLRHSRERVLQSELEKAAASHIELLARAAGVPVLIQSDEGA
jgi:hypothetical protein